MTLTCALCQLCLPKCASPLVEAMVAAAPRAADCMCMVSLNQASWWDGYPLAFIPFVSIQLTYRVILWNVHVSLRSRRHIIWCGWTYHNISQLFSHNAPISIPYCSHRSEVYTWSIPRLKVAPIQGVRGWGVPDLFLEMDEWDVLMGFCRIWCLIKLK